MPTSSIRLEHVGIAVADATHTAAVLEKVLGLPVYKIEEVTSERVRTHFLDAGGAKLELVEATEPDSPIAKFLEKNREGLHHLAFEVGDIDRAWKRAREAGLEVLGDGPKTGADGMRIFFLHPRSTGGLLVEFCARQPVTLAPRFIEATGQHIATYTAGRAGAPPLLVLPDAGQTVHPELAGLMQGLAGRWHVVAIDGPDAEDTRPTPLGLEAMGRQAAAVMDAYAWPAAAVLGFGLGASAALFLAGSHPERVTAVVAHAPRVMPANTRPPAAPVLISGYDADPTFTPADAARMLERYPDARLTITPDMAWGAAHPAMRWLGDTVKNQR